MKRRKRQKKEKNGVIKFVFLAAFILLLACALFIQKNQQSQSIASSPLAPLLRLFTYSPQRGVQIGWFTVFYPTATPAPTSAPTPTVTPCPFVLNSNGQRVAYVARPTTPPLPTEPPFVLPTNTQGPTNTPRPTKTQGPTRTPTLSPTPGGATIPPITYPPITENPCP